MSSSRSLKASRRRGYRLTASRKAIVDALRRTMEHLSAEDILARVRRSDPTCGLTTVYRALDVLSDAGLLARRDFGDGRTRYELSDGNGPKTHHHHLVCRQCKQAVDYSDFGAEELAFLNRTQKGLARKYGFDIDDHDIVFRGRCPSCRRTRRPP